MNLLLHIALSNAVIATGLAVLAAGAGRFLRRPLITHSLWVLVLLKLLTPSLVAVPIWSLPADGLQVDVARQQKVEAAEPEAPLVLRAGVGAEAPAGPEAEPPLGVNKTTDSRSWSWPLAIFIAWSCGTISYCLLAGIRFVRFRRLLRTAQPAPAGVHGLLERLCAKLDLHRCPDAWLVAGRTSPMLWALWGRARLLLPSALWETLDADQRQTLLLHELAHLRRRDHWVRRLELAATALYWWHPAVWWAQRGLRDAEEQCCDALVMRLMPDQAEAYAEAIVETVAYLSQARNVLPLGASGFGHVHLLKRRLVMILNGTAPQALSRGGLWAVLALGLFCLPLLPTWAQREAPAAVQQPADDDDQEDHARETRRTIRELSAQISEARTRLQALEARLRRAQNQLARFEGRSQEAVPAYPETPRPVSALWATPHSPYSADLPKPTIAPGAPAQPSTPTATWHRLPPVPAVPPVEAVPGQPLHQLAPPAVQQPRGNYEDRLSSLEGKVDQLLRELRTLRETRPRRVDDQLRAK